MMILNTNSEISAQVCMSSVYIIACNIYTRRVIIIYTHNEISQFQW